MAKTKKNKRSRSKTRSKRLKNKIKIADVPISNRVSMGTLETLGDVEYHYQSYDNIFNFLKILKKDKKINNLLCFPLEKNDWLNTFIKINLNTENIKRSELVLKNIELRNEKENIKIIYDLVKVCENAGKRFFVCTVMLIVPGKPGSHANIIVIDLKEKTIELFEPHGKRTELSTLDSLEGAYHISDKLLKKMFKDILPKYRYISPQTYLPTYGLQARIDAYTGLCVTWSIMYVHYRLLNPNINRKTLVRYMSKLSKNFLLKYAKYIEETIKMYKFD
jgi:hypothetical protein